MNEKKRDPGYYRVEFPNGSPGVAWYGPVGDPSSADYHWLIPGDAYVRDDAHFREIKHRIDIDKV